MEIDVPRKLSAKRYPIKYDETKFLGDVNYPDGMVLSVGSSIKKRWKIQNVGKVPWENRFLQRMGATRGTGFIETPLLTPIPDTNPGQTVIIEIPMRMPSYAATVHAAFKMVDTAGFLCFPDRKGLFVSFNIEDPTPYS